MDSTLDTGHWEFPPIGCMNLVGQVTDPLVLFVLTWNEYGLAVIAEGPATSASL